MMETKHTLSISIVLYNNEEEVLNKTINSVLNSRLSVNYKLRLIDNSPTNWLKEKIIRSERIEYFHNPSNPGFGAAHNIALRKSIEDGMIYHLVLNPDVFFDENVLDKLYLFMEENKNIGNVMPKVLYPDGSIQYLCKLLPTPYDWIARRFNPIKSMIDRRNQIFELRFTDYNKIMEVPYLSGCFMFLRIESLKEIGLFDEKIFMYGEETDLCRRLIQGGYNTVFNPNIEIFHYFEKGSHKSFKLMKIGIQSAIYYFNKWGWFFDEERKTINKEVLRKLYE